MDNVDIGGLYICNRKVLLVPGFLDVSDYWKNEYDVKYLKMYSVIFFPPWTFCFDAGTILIGNWLLKKENHSFDYIFFVKKHLCLLSPPLQKKMSIWIGFTGVFPFWQYSRLKLPFLIIAIVDWGLKWANTEYGHCAEYFIGNNSLF